ncbi:MAG: hypothetical protein WBD13_16690 [Burkholderiaceae bacterium]
MQNDGPVQAHVTAAQSGEAADLAGILLSRLPGCNIRSAHAGSAITLIGVFVVVSGGELERLTAFRLNDGDALILPATVLNSAYTLGLRRRPPASAMDVFTALAAIAFLATLPSASTAVAGLKANL